MTVGYEHQRDRLATEIEFLRMEIAAGINAARDIFDIHEAMEAARQAAFALAMKEHGFDFQAACADLSDALQRVRGIGSLCSTMQAQQGLTQ